MISHHQMTIHYEQVDFYSSSSRCSSALTSIYPRWTQALYRMPRSHLRVLAPIMLVQTLPCTRTTSGGWYPPRGGGNVRVWQNKEARTGVTNEELDRVIATRQGRGLIAVTLNAMRESIPHLTLMHEVGHCVDFHLHIVTPGTTINTYAGQYYKAKRPNEYAAEAYARAMCCRIPRICRHHDHPECITPGETAYQCGMRTVQTLRNTPAFTGCAGWGPIR